MDTYLATRFPPKVTRRDCRQLVSSIPSSATAAVCLHVRTLFVSNVNKGMKTRRMMRRFDAFYLAALCCRAVFGEAAAERANPPAHASNAMTCLEVVGNALLPRAELEASL